MTPDFLKEPDGFNWGHFTNSKGADIRYGHAKPKGEVKGSVVVLPGFRESIEKYFEVVNEMLDRGLEVWCMDWRGQGGSERYLKDAPQKAHHEGYAEQIDTLHQFVDKVVTQDNDGPLLMAAHSMGGHIGLRYLKEHPGQFDGAILTAPMIDIELGGLPKPLARLMTKFAKAGGYLDKYIPGGCDWSEDKAKFDGNDKTHDRARFEAAEDIQRIKEDLRIGDPTYGWVIHTLESIDILNDENYLRAIKTPILMQASGQDTIVSNKAIDRAAKLLPMCRKVDIANAKHEIWNEADITRAQWLNQVDAFLAERFSPPKAAPKKPKAHAMMRRPKR